jgi:hypothetical protein
VADDVGKADLYVDMNVLIGDDVDRLHVKRMTYTKFHLYSYS